MYEHILVPVDGSPTGRIALEHAIALAKEQKAQLRLLYVVEQMPPWAAAEGQMDITDALTESGKAILAEALALARKEGIDSNGAIVDQSAKRVARVIADEAEKWPADLIVMGTHGRRGIDLLILGSVAEGVVRTAKAPVLLIRGS
jgi:nucleotide-binding universal stress UspA family protein